ncbi:MAG: nucleotidyltransferase [Methanomicrobiales archaeon]|nr:nucleotidyltransferase [Methanomicrobiales archaeon]
MGVAEWFTGFNQNLIIQDGGTISSRYKAITRRLNTDFRNSNSDTSHSYYVGSYGRNTAIKGISDLDIIFELPYEVYTQYNNYSGNGQSALLQQVRNSMQKTYSTTSISGNGQVVVVSFQDGITFEVVPAFINTDKSYTYPDPNNYGSWKVTNPKPEIASVKERNASCNNNLIPLCRMMRAWKREWKVPIGGLLIDTLAYQFINSFPHKDKSYLYYDFMCRDFFKWMSEQDPEQEFWKAPGSNQKVNGKGLFQAKAKKCYNLSLEAILIAGDSNKKDTTAKQKWREIFGTEYPS